jgi:hypothetical protein
MPALRSAAGCRWTERSVRADRRAIPPTLAKGQNTARTFFVCSRSRLQPHSLCRTTVIRGVLQAPNGYGPHDGPAKINRIQRTEHIIKNYTARDRYIFRFPRICTNAREDALAESLA